jgi:hypothetical protein
MAASETWLAMPAISTARLLPLVAGERTKTGRNRSASAS